MGYEVLEIDKEIKAYFKRIGGVMMKVVKLSGGLLSVSNGRIIFRDKIAPFPFGAENSVDVAKAQFKRIDFCLEYMSANGITPRYLAEIGKSLNTLYAIHDDYVKNGPYVPSVEKQEKENRSTPSDFSKFVMPKEFSTDLIIPIGLNEKRKSVISWQPNDGVLSVNAAKEKRENVNAFIQALIVRFFYSFPKATAQLLYCCRDMDYDMNIFLTGLMNKVGNEFFFERTKCFGNGNDKYSSDIVDVIARLYNLCFEDRTLLLSESMADSLLEYNSKNPNNVQSPILVILQDYPVGFENCANLEYLLHYGKKYGVFIAVVNSKGKLTKNSYSDETAPDPNAYADLIMSFENEAIKFEDVEFNPTSISNDKTVELLEPLKEMKEKSRGIVSYEDVGFGSEKQDSKLVTDEISIPVGKVDDKVFTMDFAVAGKDSKPIAYMIIGQPKSGKSSIVDSLIINGCMKYSPDDLCFYLIDFKDGVSSAPYIGNAKMPHIKLVAQKSKQEEAEIILETVLREKERRNDIFTQNDCQNLVEYNKKADERGEKHLPRIIVSIDEFHAIFKDDGDAGRSQRLSNYCQQIVKEARSAGIHLVITSQNADRKIMNCVGDFISGRFCFDVANIEHAEALFRNRQNAMKVKSECSGKSGVAMVSYDAGESVKKIRGSYHMGKRNEYAEQVRKRWSGFAIDTAVVGDDSVMNYSSIKDKKGIYADLSYGAPIGISYYDHRSVTLPFDGMHHTLMVAGGDDGIQTDHLLSVMMYAVKSNAQVLLLDESNSLMLDRAFENCKNVERYTHKEYLDMLSKANEELKNRIENRRQRFAPYFVVIHSLHMISAFTENRKSGGAPAIPSGYNPIGAVRETQLKSGGAIEGQTTLMQMLKNANNANNFYLCFSINPDVIPYNFRNSAVGDVKLKIFHYPFTTSMEYLTDKLYSHKKLGMTCPESLSLYSESNRPFEKVRYFHYDNNDRTIKTVKEVLKNEN